MSIHQKNVAAQRDELLAACKELRRALDIALADIDPSKEIPISTAFVIVGAKEQGDKAIANAEGY